MIKFYIMACSVEDLTVETDRAFVKLGGCIGRFKSWLESQDDPEAILPMKIWECDVDRHGNIVTARQYLITKTRDAIRRRIDFLNQ